MNASAARRQHAADLCMHAWKVCYVLQHVRREYDVDAGIRQWDGPTVVILDRKNAVGCIVRLRDLDRGNLEAPPLQFQRLLTGTGPDFENAPAGRKQRRDLV